LNTENPHKEDSLKLPESLEDRKSEKWVKNIEDENMEEEKKSKIDEPIMEVSSKNEDKLDLDEEDKSSADSVLFIREEINSAGHVITRNGRIVNVEPPELKI
jgi:hypothetical protein